MTDSPPAAPPRLRLAGISKRYASTQANADIDLTVAPGEIHALLGENGAGKSTLVKIICGLVKPDAGTIAWDGRAVAAMDPDVARRLGIAHGVPALLAVRDADGGREHRPRPARPREHRRAERAHRRDVAPLRAARRSRAARAPPLGRRAAAGRDRALPAAEPAPADHGRADLGADAAGGGPAVRHAAPAGRGGLQHPLYQPQAGGDRGAVRRGDGAARRPGRGALRPARETPGGDGRADGRAAACRHHAGPRRHPGRRA